MKELHIFDLDGTLYASPKPPDGNMGWYNYIKSFGQPGLPGFDPRWHTPVVVAARRSAQDPSARTILVTGRPDYQAMRKLIETMLRNAGIDFSAVWLRPVHWNLSIPLYKARVVAMYLHADPEIRKVVVWDDEEPNHSAMRTITEAAGLTYVAVPS